MCGRDLMFLIEHFMCKNQAGTFVMGPAGVRNELADDPEPGLDEVFGRKAVIDWETPSARMNCSRSSILVRPFASVVVRTCVCIGEQDDIVVEWRDGGWW